ncbi:MAG: hypothetical protein J6J62_09095 [Oscillospiraceae bacterium]|nr:hypothetical protein [Oscillospiraceae bacterium]
MDKTRQVKRYTNEALKASFELDRDTYKNIKHMDKVALSNYLLAVYVKGYQAGAKSAPSGNGERSDLSPNGALPADVPDNSDGEIE